MKKTPKQIERLNAVHDKVMGKPMPEGFTSGYTGNCGTGKNAIDDRNWVIFRAHPGRVGTADDCIGGFSTQERYKLLPLLNAIKFALNFS